MRSRESYFFRRKLLYDHSEGVLHIEAVLGFVSLILTVPAIVFCTMPSYTGDPLLFIIFGALTGLAGFILSWIVIVNAVRYRKIRRILTAILGNLMSVTGLIANVLMFMIYVLHIVPDFFMRLV